MIDYEKHEYYEKNEQGFAVDENGYVLMPAITRWSIGCDVGQSRDYSSVVIVEERREPTAAPDSTGIRQLGKPLIYFKKMVRIPLGTSYSDVLSALYYEMNRLPNPYCYIDASGNRALVDLANAMGIEGLTKVQITAGNEWKSGWSGAFRTIAKQALMCALNAALERDELRFPRTKDADALIAEMNHYVQTYSVTGQMLFSNKGIAHDDLVVAAALSVFPLVEGGIGVSCEPAPWLVAPPQAPAPKNPVVKTNEQLGAERSTMLVRG